MRSLHRGALLVGLASLAACGRKPEVEPTPPPLERLSPGDQVMRASMALRGIRPSLADLEAVRKDPGNFEAIYEGLVDVYLESEEFGETIKDLHAELYLLRTDTELQLPAMGLLAERGYNQAQIYSSTVEAPLKFIEDLVMRDRPYTEILTAQHTLADPVVADIYGLAYDPAGPQWQPTRWIDGRPQSGLLSDSQIWRKYISNASNKNRGRANFISKAFLCEDIGGRDIIPAEGVDLSDPEIVASALRTNTSCIGCHSVLDPLASFMWGYKETVGGGFVAKSIEAGCEGTFFPQDPSRSGFETGYEFAQWCYPIKFYNADEAQKWQQFELPHPGYFGSQAENMTDLGELITEDPRFAQCTVRTFFGYLNQIERGDVPLEIVSDLQVELESSAFSVKHLVKSIVMSEGFRSIRRNPSGEIALAEAGELGSDERFVAGLQTIRPEQYARTIEELTGFRWLSDLDPEGCDEGVNTCWGNQDLGLSDLYGYRSMAGGVDSMQITHATHTVSPTKMLTMSMQAEQAAGYVVDLDFSSDPEDRRLLSLVEPDTFDEDLVRKQIVWLHDRILGEQLAPYGRSTDRSFTLWVEALEQSAGSEPAEAWKVLVSALLQDVRMIYY